MITRSTLLFGAHGSFEEVTIKKWKTLRVLAHKASGNLTNISDPVKLKRSALPSVVRAFKEAGELIQIGYQEWASKMGQYAKFVSFSLRYSCTGISPTQAVFNWDSSQIAQGSIPFEYLNDSPTASAGAGTVILPLPDTLGYKNLGTDIIGVHVHINNEPQEPGTSFSVVNAGTRADGTLVVTAPAGFLVEGDYLIVSWFYYGAPGTDTAGKSSTSQTWPVTVSA